MVCRVEFVRPTLVVTQPPTGGRVRFEQLGPFFHLLLLLLFLLLLLLQLFLLQRQLPKLPVFACKSSHGSGILGHCHCQGRRSRI